MQKTNPREPKISLATLEDSQGPSRETKNFSRVCSDPPGTKNATILSNDCAYIGTGTSKFNVSIKVTQKSWQLLDRMPYCSPLHTPTTKSRYTTSTKYHIQTISTKQHCTTSNQTYSLYRSLSLKSAMQSLNASTEHLPR